METNTRMAADSDILVIGGGLVGTAVAYGLASRGQRVTLLDEDDRALRASRGNFGLVWVQSKGDGLIDYARWTRLSATTWPGLAADLLEQTGVDVQLSQPGGLHLCLSDGELEERTAMLSSMRARLDGDYGYEILDHAQVKALIPEIGPKVVGATLGTEDGHANPLRLLRALHAAFARHGGRLVNGASVDGVIPEADGSFSVGVGGTVYRAPKVVLAAGLGNRRLAPSVGLEAPVGPQRGQVLICERVRPFLRYPTAHVRQTGEGGLQIGDSHEDAGFDTGTTTHVLAAIARRAVDYFPFLGEVGMVRAWGALRVLSPDGYPIYQQSRRHPGAYVVTCHSGVTLAAAHAGALAAWIATGEGPSYLEVFNADRFAVQKVA